MKKVLLFSFVLMSVMIGCKKDNDVSSTAEINSVKVIAWPAYDGNGSSWDSTSAPDIYLELLDGNFAELSNHPFDDSTFVDATTGFEPQYVLITPYRLASLEGNYYFELIDDDVTDGDDNMGKVKFNLADYPNHPSKITISDTASGITMEVGLRWD